MSDVAFGLSTDTLDNIVKHVYDKQYPKYFKDKTPFKKDGKDYELDWDIVRPPVFDLKSEVDLDQLAHDLVGEWDSPELTRDELLRSLAGSYEHNKFFVDLPKVDLTLTVDKTPAHDTATVRITAAVDGSGHNLVVTPLAAKVSTGKEFPDWVYNEQVVPIVLEAARRLLAGLPVPIPTVEGITLTQPVVVVTADHLVCTANLAGKSLPDPVAGDWPSSPFFAVLGPDAIQAVTVVGTRAVDGMTASPHDETGLGIGKGYYKATIAVNDVRSDGHVTDGRTITVTAAVSGSGAAGIKYYFFGWSTDGFFDLTLNPNPTATVRLDLDDAVLSAKTVEVGDFKLHLTPTRGDIVSVVLSWVTNALSGFISPYVGNAMRGISFDIYRVPTLHVDYDAVHFDAKPADLVLTADNGAVTVLGRLEITDR